MAAIAEVVEASSSSISEVKVSPATDGFAELLNLSVTVTGDDVAAAEIDAFLAAATGVIPEHNQRINFNVRRSDGLERISIVEQAQELGMPEIYVHSEYTLAIPLEWLEQNYGSTP